MADPDRAPFPVTVPRTHTLAEIRQAYPDLAPGAETGQQVGVTGRVIFVRNTGKLCFATLREGGVELQVMLSADRTGPEALADWKSDVDLGDQVFVTGEVISSRRGELSVLADGWRMTAKALRPLPVAHKPMSEETRVRQRYVDLIVRPDARRMVLVRAQVLAAIRCDPAPARLPRGRDAGPAVGARRRGRPAIPDPPQCIRPADVAANRAGVISEARGGGWNRTCFRNRQDLPQRRDRLHPFGGIHHARGV